MQKVTITNQKGESITLGNYAPYYLETIEGTSDVPVTIISQKAPKQDGSTYIDNTFDNRALTLEGMIITRNSPDEVLSARRIMQEIFNPKLGEVTITYYHRSMIYEIKAIAESTPQFPNSQGNKGIFYQRYLVNLICHQPFWMDTYYESREMSYIIGGLRFTVSFPTEFSDRGFQRKATNTGDVPTPVTIELKGPAIDPKITNETTGEFIKINRELSEEDILSISTAFGEKHVLINNINAFHYIDLGSTFWQLIPGENILSYTSNNDSINTKVLVKWKNRYVGL